MSDLSQEAVLDRIDSLLPLFDTIARKGFAVYRSIDPKIRLEHSRSAAAGCTYCHIAAEAERQFVERTDIRPADVGEGRSLRVWHIEDHTVVRFKKMDATGAGRNYQTKQTKAYDRGDDIPELPAAGVRLTVGYLLDAAESQILRTQIARPRGRYVEWCAAIIPVTEQVSGQRGWTDVTVQRRLIVGGYR